MEEVRDLISKFEMIKSSNELLNNENKILFKQNENLHNAIRILLLEIEINSELNFYIKCKNLIRDLVK
jgi:hypothetical protein